jgi:hypothetical protein
MMQGENWICWEPKEAPALPGARLAEKPVRERPIQEPQFGPHIDSMPVECNPSAPAHSRIMPRVTP